MYDFNPGFNIIELKTTIKEKKNSPQFLPVTNEGFTPAIDHESVAVLYPATSPLLTRPRPVMIGENY